jgi:hypothetical protein
MCLYLFAPTKELEIEFASESVNLLNGGSEAIFDVLVRNRSRSSLNRIHVVYPHPIPLNVPHRSAYFQDITETWLNKESRYNRFYQSEERHLNIARKEGFDLVTVDSPDPQNVLDQLPYSGIVCGKHHLTPFELTDGNRLTTDQWTILSELGWSVWTVKLEMPLERDSSRWMRFRAWSGVNRQNNMPPLERFLKKHGGKLVDFYEITGPIDMRYRIISALKTAGALQHQGEEYAHLRMELHGLHQQLLIALQSEGTQTIINDWRLNIFAPYYHYIDNISAEGDIAACGPGKNQLRDNTGRVVTCYQWKAGKRNIDPQTNDGRFQIFMHAHDIPNFTIALPWISLLVGVLSLLISAIGILIAVLVWVFTK